MPKFLYSLWDEPDLIAKLLLNSNISDVKNTLAPFICHNFYQNIISPYSVEENLLFVYTLMLKEEINKLNSVNQLNEFLEKTACGYMLGELRNKSEIQTYSKNIIQTLIEKIEEAYSEKKIELNIINLTNDIKQMEINLKKKNKDIENLEDLIFLKNVEYAINGNDEENKEEFNYFNTFKIKNKKDIDLFNEKYVPNLNKKEIKNIINNYDAQLYMKEFLSHYINECSNDNNLFSNENLIQIIYESKYSKILLALYQLDFLKIIRLLDLFLDSFLNSIQLLPYSVKFICRIISIFIRKKFPKIEKFQENAFIGQFLFTNLLIPIFKNPLKAYINDFIISGNTLDNLKLLLEIFAQLFLGNLFNNSDNMNYTPFNWYFIQKMPKIFDFYEEITKIEFPQFIDKYINEELPEDYKYDYFIENPDEIISHRSICFTIKDIICLIDSMIKSKNILFPDINIVHNINNNVIINIEDNIDNINNNVIRKNNIENKNEKNSKIYKIVSKLNSEFYKSLLNNIKKRIDLESIKATKPIPNHVLIYDLLINPEYNNLFNVENKKDHFYIKELSKIETEEDSKKNYIIKVKNYFCGLLYNCRKLNKLDFTSKNTTLDILKEIKLLLKTNEFVIDNTIPYEWYVNSLLDYLKKIPEDLIENDYEKLYKELEDDINKSIEIVDFYMMSDCFGKIKYTKKAIDYNNKMMKLIIDIDLNEKVKDIIENKKMPVEMQFKFNDNEKVFKLYDPTIAERQISDLFMGEVNRNCRICLTIEHFIKYFPNLVKIQLLKGINILKEIKDLRITKKINDYIIFISNNITKEKLFTKDELKIVKDKIFNFILNKLYEKLYPAYPSNNDLLILRNCLQLSWIEPKHLILNAKNNNYDIFMDDIKQFFTELEKEKSPKKKFKIITDIFMTISKIIAFNGGESRPGADDNISLLLYIFVRVIPKKIYSDIEYMRLFIKDNNGTEDNQLTQLVTVCEAMKNINYNHLFDVTEEEYRKNCNLSLAKMNHL